MDSLGKRIKHYRKEAGLTQGQLAKACGWGSQSRVGNYELDTREPSFADLEAIADAVGVDITALIKRSDNETMAYLVQLQEFSESLGSPSANNGLPSTNNEKIKSQAAEAASTEYQDRSFVDDLTARAELKGLIEKLHIDDVEDLLKIARARFFSSRDHTR
ncbi:MAG: transcriptional regulator [Sphingopyxis sp.]|nr:MAG: transcriptional regulator [Sphingopyxis sp.]